MGTTLRFKVGVVLALLGLLTLALNPPLLTLAQDDQPAEVESAQSTQDEADEPPVVEDEQPADEPVEEEPVEEEPVEEEPVEEVPADTTAPSIGQPENRYAAAVDASGAVVEFGRPDASDDVDGSVGVDCAPGSGSLFPLGETVVTCSAWDAAGNGNSVSFSVVVSDQTSPSIDGAHDVVADAVDASGAAVEFAIPSAWDNVDGEIAVACDAASGAVFPIGTTVVTCWAQDSAGNSANAVSFSVTVNALLEPTPTDEPTQEPTAVPTDEPTDEPTDTPTESPTKSPTDIPNTPNTPDDPKPTAEPTKTTTPKPDGETSDPSTEPTPDPLELPSDLIGSFTIVTDGGPLSYLTAIWGGLEFPVSQEYGHTEFSITHHSWYAYGLEYGTDGFEHPGLDIGMPRGTALYSPVEGVVKISGGTPYYTFYGNGEKHVGELLIETKDGDQIILGHMGRIAVDVGDEVKIGQFVGLSGGENGDHLHLEVRMAQPLGGFKVVDPRDSILMDILEKEAKKAEAAEKSDGKSFDSLSSSNDRQAAVGETTSDKYARITVRRVNCSVDEAGDAVAACGGDVLSGSSFTVYNPTNHGKTRVTDPTGLVSFGPRAGENTISKEVKGEFDGAYVSCVAENTGRVVFDGPITEPTLTLNTEPGDQITCDWFNLTS